MKTKLFFAFALLFVAASFLLPHLANGQNPPIRSGFSVAASSKAQFRSDVALDGQRVLVPYAKSYVGTGRTADTGVSASVQYLDTTKAILLPILTTTQRGALDSINTGLFIYYSTTGKLNVYNGTTWKVVTFD